MDGKIRADYWRDSIFTSKPLVIEDRESPEIEKGVTLKVSYDDKGEVANAFVQYHHLYNQVMKTKMSLKPIRFPQP